MHDLFLDGARLWVVGINPGTRSELVDAPFAHPGNRFWPAMHKAGITPHLVDARDGLSDADRAMMRERGIGFTNVVTRSTPSAASLSREEYREGGRRLRHLAGQLRPRGIMVAGIGAYREAFAEPKAVRGLQPSTLAGVPVWVVGNPSGLNAHETVDTLAESYREVWEATASSQ